MVVFNENNSLISIKLGNIDNSGNNSSNKNIENKYGNSKFQLKDKMMKQITHTYKCSF